MKKLIILLLTSLTLVSVNVHAKQDKSKKLPPGLQMKADKGQALSSGWKKKLSKGSTLNKTVYDQGKIIVPIDDKGIVTIRVEDKMIRLMKATREIVDNFQ
jgi:hypothetical protein